GGLRAINAAERRAEWATLGAREAYSVSDIGNGITVRVDLDLVQRSGRERVRRSGPGRVCADRRMHVHDQDRLASVSRLRKGIQIGKVQTRVPMGKPEIGTGIVVRHTALL